ncbi:uncharacterized protein [Engystomops pustulosus]|uniref:uncharacterized protein n=1 Tax=Engystomops pustulosus TaxID=76066 RepID=UPI003AFA882B
MDFSAREQSWLVQANQVFGSEPITLETEGQRDVCASQSHLKSLLHKKTRIWWNKISLEKYIQQGLVPRGLRIQVFPSFPVEDEDMISKWEANCTECSMKFMGLLIELNKKTLTEIDAEIDTVRKTLVESMTKDSLMTFNQRLDEDFKEWEKKIQETKAKKYTRDVMDFQQKRMYRWRKPHFTLFNRRSMSRSSSFSSNASLNDHTEGANYNGRGRQGQGGKRKLVQNQPESKRKPETRSTTSSTTMNTPASTQLKP